MSYIISSLPPIKCFVRREFLYNHTKGHGELEPAIWVSIKALRGQVFRIESLLPAYGALYDKLPIHAYVWKEDHGDLTIDALQLWDCMGYRFTIIEKIGLRNLGVKFLSKDKEWCFGRYLFTVDYAESEVAEDPAQHKQTHVLILTDAGKWTGNIVALPNNRVRVTSPAYWVTGEGAPDFKPSQWIHCAEQDDSYLDPNVTFNNLYVETTK